MAYGVIWSAGALNDVEEISQHHALRSEQTARRVARAIIKSVGVLREFPRIGPLSSIDPSQTVREILSGPHRIFYTVEDESQRVEILAVWHSARSDPDPDVLTNRLG